MDETSCWRRSRPHSRHIFMKRKMSMCLVWLRVPKRANSIKTLRSSQLVAASSLVAISVSGDSFESGADLDCGGDIIAYRFVASFDETVPFWPFC